MKYGLAAVDGWRENWRPGKGAGGLSTRLIRILSVWRYCQPGITPLSLWVLSGVLCMRAMANAVSSMLSPFFELTLL